MQSVGVEHRGRVSSIVYHTSNGTTYWKPNVPEEFVSVKDMEFETWDDAVNMYNTYADKSGFSIRLSTIKRVKGSVTHRYMLCTRADKPKFQDFYSTNSNSASTSRRSSSKAVCCNARLRSKLVPNTMRFKIYDFVDIHTHELIGANAMEFTKKRRKIGYSERNFIHKLSLNKIGPNIAHNLQCSLKGGSHNVHGTKTDLQNATRDVRLFNADRDAQMIVDTLTCRSVNLPNFSFEYKVVGGELRYIFWVDDVSKFNYDAFGEVLGFDATYRTNKYGMIFLPFTGLDHHKKCVTFGAGLIYGETIESYKWLVDKQRKTQLELDIKTSTTTPKMPEKLPLEIHASKIYTRKIFLEVQKEIYRGMRQCYITSSSELDDIKKFNIAHTNKRFKVVNSYVVDFDAHDTTVSFSCMGFTGVGYMYRHAFCVFRYNEVEMIPDKYLPARWMRNVLPDRVHDISNRYSAEDDEESVIRRNMFELLTECADRLRHKPDSLNSLFVQLKDIKDKVFKEFSFDCNISFLVLANK
ncbi:protein FAR1-RELATED SEQUENCE 5-like [Bidens hawaiensis]|uniref:protein FAR1-RELATED SEQUENCE 5-like n=1 Tax=Bidens hawaiensis TaxID=980011 RepID=UPI00404AC026